MIFSERNPLLPWVMVALLIFYQSADANIFYNYTPITVSPGLYYEKIGSLSSYSEHWKLVIYLDLGNYRDEYNIVTFYYQQVERLCVACHENNFTTECDSFQKTISDSLQNIKFQDQLILELLGVSKNTRLLKRALFNAIGSVAKTLFGTLDSNDAEYYNAQIEDLKAGQQHLLNLFKQQTSIIKKHGAFTKFNPSCRFLRF